MTSLMNNQLPIRTEGQVVGLGQNEPVAIEPQSAMAVINDRLRGRMKYALSLGLLLGAILGYAGFKFAPVKYASSGNIHVAATGSAILTETTETKLVQRYDGVRPTWSTNQIFAIDEGIIA